MSKKINILLRRYKEYFKDYIVNKSFTRFMPTNPLHDDLYIVSFPRSGTTWLNFIMANVHLKMSNQNQQVTFYNIHDFIPDVMQNRYLKNNILSFPGHRVIKSHAEMNPYYTKVIYLVRDPRDVMGEIVLGVIIYCLAILLLRTFSVKEWRKLKEIFARGER